MKRIFITLLTLITMFVLTEHIIAQTHTIDGEYIKEWLMLGPFFPDNLDKDFLADVGGETNIEPKEGDTVTTEDGKTLTWKRYTSPIDWIDLREAIGEHEKATAYAACNIISTKAQTVEAYGHYRTLKIWLNEKPVHIPSHIESFPMTLDAGLNRLLIKVCGSGAYLAFQFGVRDESAYRRARGDELEIKSKKLTDFSTGALKLSIKAMSLPETLVSKSPNTVTIGIYDSNGQVLLKREHPEGESLVWSIPDDFFGDVRIIASQRDSSGKVLRKELVTSTRQLAIERRREVWKHYRYIDGLGGKTVFSVLQTKDGALWFGTSSEGDDDNGGVTRFDGTDWKTYTTEDGLGNRVVWKILQDKDGIIWAQTGLLDSSKSVNRFDGTRWKAYTTEDGLANDNVRLIFLDKGDNVWVGTDGGGASRFDEGKWHNYTTEDGLIDNKVYAIAHDAEGTYWFGTESGVSHFDGENWTNYTSKDGLAVVPTRVIFQDREGNFWFGGDDNRVSRFDGENWNTYDATTDGFILKGVADKNGIIQAKDGTLWFRSTYGSSGKGTIGVCSFDGNQWTTYTSENDLVGGWMTNMLEDNEGMIWVVAQHFEDAGGAAFFDGKHWTRYSPKEDQFKNGLAIHWIFEIFQDREGIFWFGDWIDGLTRLDHQSWIYYTIEADDSSEERKPIRRIFDILEDKDGVLWFTSGADGLYRYDGVSWINYTTADGLLTNDMRYMFQDRDGALWLPHQNYRFDGASWRKYPTSGPKMTQDKEGNLWFPGFGVSRFDGNSWKVYTQADGLADNGVGDLFVDQEGILWCMTTGGISRFDGVNWQTYPQRNGRWGAIFQGNDGVLWFGGENGLTRFDGKTWHTYTTDDGLPDNVIRDIAQDSDGTLWIATESGGVARFDGRCFQVLNTKDGLPNDTIWSVGVTRAGQIWIGSEEELVRYIPNKVPPSISIRQVTADEKIHTQLKDTVRTHAGVRRLALSYRGISFKTRPEAMVYLYQLVGEDTDWQKPTHSETAEYLNLPPGKYTFRVQAVDRDLNYSKIETLEFTIPRSKLFYGLIVAGVVFIPLLFSAFYLGKRLQTQRAIAQQFNPYIAGRVVGEDLFYGRSDLLTDIERTLANNCFLLYGERRIGKTSLQHQLRERLSNADDPTYRFIPAYIDLQGVAEEDFSRTIATGIVEHAVSLFKEALPLRLNEDRDRYTYRDLNRDLRTILDHLKEGETKTIKLVLLMDEIDTLNEYSLRTNLNLRGLFMGQLKENLVLVMSGLYLKMDWSEEGGGSPPFNFLSREIELQPLEEADARQLITEPAKGFYTYEPKAIDLILSSSELKPFTIQGICLRAVNRVLADGRTKITSDDIEAIKDSALAELQSIRGERAGTSLPGSLNEALAQLNESQSRVATLEEELAKSREV